MAEGRRLARRLQHQLPARSREDQRWPEWLAAVGDLGPELWRLFGARLDAALKERGVKPGARLVWLPTGALGILPLGLAKTLSASGGWPTTTRSSMRRAWKRSPPRRTKSRSPTTATLAAIINPTGDLSGTEKEGKLVASHFPGKRAHGAGAGGGHA